MGIGAHLAAVATLKRTTVAVEGENVLVREPSAQEEIEYREIRKVGRNSEASPELPEQVNKAIAFLLTHCVINEDGTSAVTEEQAAVIATGSGRVWIPVLEAIFSWRPREKKASPKKSSVSTESPSP